MSAIHVPRNRRGETGVLAVDVIKMILITTDCYKKKFQRSCFHQKLFLLVFILLIFVSCVVVFSIKKTMPLQCV